MVLRWKQSHLLAHGSFNDLSGLYGQLLRDKGQNPVLVSKDKGLLGARNPALPATIMVKVQVHCKLLVGRG